MIADTVKSSAKPILSAHSIRKSFKNKEGETLIALDSVSIDLFEGEIVALIGESGSGKTTLGRAILKLLTIDEGSITFNDKNLLSLKGKQLREARKHFQMIFQNQQANLHPNMSVIEMLEESLKLHKPEINETQRKEQAKLLLQ